MGNAQWFLEVALLLLLAATLFHALRLERALGVLKRDRAVLEELVQGFNDSTRQAESGIERLRSAADGAGRQISRQIEAAQLLRDDLSFLTDRSDRLAERLETAVRSARMLVDTTACTPHAPASQLLATIVPAVASSAIEPVTKQPPVTGQPLSLRAAAIEDEAEPLPRLRSQAERDLLRALRAGVVTMSFLPSHFTRARLLRPRLLPATIAAMSALIAVKSIVLVQAAAEEAAHAPAANAAKPEAAQPNDHKIQSPAPVPIAVERANAAAGQAGTAPADMQPISAAERSLLLDLRRRRETLDARARDLDQREAEIDAAARRLGERADQLTGLQAKLESLEAGRQHHAAENWTGLVKVYEAMKPREAAAIFDALDMQVLLQVLDRMQDRRAAPVLAAMQPDRARLATQMLAEMRARLVGQPATPSLSNNPKG